MTIQRNQERPSLSDGAREAQNTRMWGLWCLIVLTLVVIMIKTRPRMPHFRHFFWKKFDYCPEGVSWMISKSVFGKKWNCSEGCHEIFLESVFAKNFFLNYWKVLKVLLNDCTALYEVLILWLVLKHSIQCEFCHVKRLCTATGVLKVSQLKMFKNQLNQIFLYRNQFYRSEVV